MGIAPLVLVSYYRGLYNFAAGYDSTWRAERVRAGTPRNELRASDTAMREKKR